MATISFYHLLTTPLERALPQLLEKIYASGQHAVVRAGTPDRVAHLNAVLWSYTPNSFLPHGSHEDGYSSEQPIFLTTEDENPNRSQFLLLLDNQESNQLEHMDRTLFLFEGNDPDQTQAARSRWTTYKEAGHALAYYKQQEGGRWTML